MSEAFKYQGDELVLFQHANNWKRYFAAQIKPYLHGNILEAGAGIGATTQLLNDGSAASWLMLEPDTAMVAVLEEKIAAGKFPSNTKLQTGTIDQQEAGKKYNSIIYIDVLEHIENDAGELRKAGALLEPGGYIVVLSPAFQFLLSPFDKAIGHYRRYTKKALKKITPASLGLISCNYFDSVGYFASLTNKLMLRQQYPSLKQVMFWDKWMVPVSRFTDKLFFHSFGKSIIAIWQNKDGK